MALGSTQPLTEMCTSCISWGKGGRYVRLTTLPPSCAVVMKSGNLNFLEPSGPLQACNGSALPLPLPLYTRIEESLPVYTSIHCFQRILCYTNEVSMQAINTGNFGSAVLGTVTPTEAKTYSMSHSP